MTDEDDKGVPPRARPSLDGDDSELYVSDDVVIQFVDGKKDSYKVRVEFLDEGGVHSPTIREFSELFGFWMVAEEEGFPPTNNCYGADMPFWLMYLRLLGHEDVASEIITLDEETDEDDKEVVKEAWEESVNEYIDEAIAHLKDMRERVK